jgi:hypothetical protein
MIRGKKIMKEIRTGKFLIKLKWIRREIRRKREGSGLKKVLFEILLRRILINIKRHKKDKKILKKNKINQEMLRKIN